MSLGLRTHVIDLEQNINRIVRKVNAGGGIVVKVRASDFTQPLGRMSAKANEFTKSLEASNARVIAFGASAAIIGGVTLGFTQLVVQATKVEKILTDINVVLNTSTQNLEKFGNSLFKVARNTSQTLEVAAEAALEFSRQGLSMEETLKRTNDALILTRLTSLKAADSVKGLTAAVNGFADAGMTTAMVINKLSAVDIKFAVSTDDLINALSRAGAVAQDAGVSFDQLMGAVTSAQQITARGGAVIGNSFKTIFTRVQRGSTLQSLEDLGIAVRDIRGNTLPAMTVLQNLSSTYEKLGATTKAAVAEQVGGVFQINILKAAIKDLNAETSIYSQATKASSSATNEAYTKNAQLQKTLSSIANQTLTTVRELTANLGSLTIAPALQDFLSSANEVLGSFNKLFGDTEGESIGGDFAKGFARGLGSVLMGPGMMVAVLVFAKLFSQAFKFAKSSVKDLLQIQSIKEKEKAIQESIVDAMIKNVALSKELVKIDGDQVKQEQIVLALLKEQTAHIEQQRRIASDISPALRRAGVQPNLIVSKGSKHGSDGLIPNYSNTTPLERERERSGAQKGGYTAGAIAKMHVPKLGEVVYNKRESVRKFPGMQQPAIIPPISSKAGKKYQDNFSERHGFDPYGSSNNSTYNGGLIPNFASNTTEKSAIRAILDTLKKRKVKVLPNDPKLSFAANRYMEATKDREYPGGSVNFGKHKISMNEITLALKKHGNYMGDEDFYGNKAGGLIPNFALGASQLAGTNILKLPKAKMATQTTKSDFRGNRVKGWKNLEAPLDSIQKSAASYADEFNVLKGLGINVLQRKMFFTNKEDGGIRKSINTTDRKMAKSRGFQKNNRDNIAGSSYESGLYKNHLKDKGYNETWTGGYTPKGFQKGTGDPQSTVDFFKAGRLPIEAKYGKFTQANLIAKSIRLSSDRYIEDFLSSRGEGDIANNMANKKFQDASSTLSSLGHKNVDKSMVKKFGLSSGLVPNFMSIGLGPHMNSSDWLTSSLNLTRQNWDQGQNLKDGSFSDWVDFITKDRQIGVPLHYRDRPSKIDEIAQNKSNSKRARQAKILYNDYLKNFTNTNTKKIKMSKFGNVLEMALAQNFGKKPTSASYPMDFTHNPIHKLDGNPIVSRQTLGLNSQVGDAVVTSSGHEKNKFFSKILAHQIKSGSAVLGKRGKFPARIKNTGGYNDLIGHSGKTKLDKTVTNHTATGAQLTKKNGILGKYLNPKQSYKLDKYKKDFWSYDELGIKAGQAVSNSQGFIPNYLNTEEFGDTSTSAAQFNQNNGLDLQTALSGGKGFKLTKSNFQKVRQFLNSAEFRSLPAGIKTQLTNKLRIQSKFLKMGDVTRPYLKGKTSFPGRIAVSGGLIPNFSNPLAEAIGREKAALSSQGSTAKVYVDQDQRLKDTLNPMGLMVANRRDEPISGAQGVNRAINQGLNPKTHGSSNNSTYDSGLIPNFNSPVVTGTGGSVFAPGIKELDKAAKDTASKVKDHGKSSKEASGSGMDMMGAMFALTSVSYAVEGALGDVDSSAGALVKTLNAGIMGASQGVMVWQGLSSVGDSLIKKNTKMGKAMGVGTKILGGLGAAVGVLVPVFQALGENTSMLDGPFETLAKSVKETSKSIGALGNAITAHTDLESTRSEISQLNNSQDKNTYDGRMKLLTLQTKEAKNNSDLIKSAGELGKALNLTGADLMTMTSGTALGMEKLQENMLKYQQALAVETAMMQFTKGLGSGGFAGMFKQEGTDYERRAGQVGVAQQIASQSENPKQLDEQLKVFMKAFSTLKEDSQPLRDSVSTYQNVLAAGNKTGFGRSAGSLAMMANSAKNELGMGVDVSKITSTFESSVSKLPVAYQTLASQIIKNAQSMEIGDIESLLKGVESNARLLVKDSKKSAEQQVINYKYLRETTRLNRELANRTQLSLNQDKINLSLGKEKQGVLKSARAHNIKYLAALGATTKAATLESEMLEKSKQIDQDLMNKKTEINNKYKAEGIKYIDTLFNDKKNSLIDPVLTQSQGGKDSSGKSLSAEKTWEKSQKELQSRMIAASFNNKGIEEGGTQDPKLLKLKKDLGLAQNQERVSFLFKEYIHSLKDSVKQQEALNNFQKAKIIPEQIDLATFFSHSVNLKNQEIKTEEDSAKVKKINLDVVRAQLNMEKGTLSHAQKRLTDIKAIPYHQLDEVTKEQIDTNKTVAQADYEILRNKEIYLSFGEGLASLQSEQLEVERLRVKKESDSLNTQSKRLDAEEKLRKSTDDYKNIIRLKVENELKTLRNSTDDDITTLKEEKKQGAFGKRTEAGNSQLVRDEERAMLNHIEALKQGTYSLGALHSMAESTRSFEKALIEAKTKLENGGDFLEGQQGVILDTAHQKGGIEKLKGEKSVFNDRGATVRVAETDLKIAQAHKELNLTMGEGSLFADSMRVKIAEANVEMSRFGETMANTAFDATKEGFKGLIQDMGDGTKSLGDVAANFFGTIVDRMNEKLIDRAAGQLTAGLMEAAGFNQGGHVGFNQGGHVSRYSSGGTTRQVPAMLTSGEYVVQKRIVDRLGTNELNKINDSGSLEELYDKPNNESFSLLNEGGIASPPIIKLKEGGVAKNYLSGIVGTINKFMGGIVKMAGGGILSSSPDDSAGMKMAKGAGYLAGSSLHAYQNRGEGNQGPSAPKAPTALNTHSSLNIDPTGNRMSAKYKANDSYRQDYGKYLLDKYQHDVDTNNQKVKSRASTAQGIVNGIGFMGIGMAASAAGDYAKAGGFTKEGRMAMRAEKDAAEYAANPQAYAPPAKGSERMPYHTGGINFNSPGSANSNPAGIGGGVTNNVSNSTQAGNNYHTGGMNFNSSRSTQSNLNKVNDYSWTKNNNLSSGLKNPYQLNQGGMIKMSSGGKVHGPGGIDKVGPVMLDRGEFVIKSSSVNKIEKQSPGFFNRLNSMKMYEGGIVDPSAKAVASTTESGNTQNSSSNVTININVSSGGETSVSGGEAKQQAFASKIKEAVVGIISQEKRVGGMLSGN